MSLSLMKRDTLQRLRSDHPAQLVAPQSTATKATTSNSQKVVTRIVRPGIGGVVEGGEKDVHAGNGLQKADPAPRIHLRQNSNTPQIRSNPKRDCPVASVLAAQIEAQDQAECRICRIGPYGTYGRVYECAFARIR